MSMNFYEVTDFPPPPLSLGITATNSVFVFVYVCLHKYKYDNTGEASTNLLVYPCHRRCTARSSAAGPADHLLQQSNQVQGKGRGSTQVRILIHKQYTLQIERRCLDLPLYKKLKTANVYMKCWIQLSDRVKTFRPGPPSPASPGRTLPVLFTSVGPGQAGKTWSSPVICISDFCPKTARFKE